MLGIPNEDLERAARAVYRRVAEAGRDTSPHSRWEDLSADSQLFWRDAVLAAVAELDKTGWPQTSLSPFALDGRRQDVNCAGGLHIAVVHQTLTERWFEHEGGSRCYHDGPVTIRAASDHG